MPESSPAPGRHMSSEVSWFDRALDTFITRVSGRTVVAIALILYPGVGLLLPLTLDWPRLWLVDANLVGVGSAAILTVGWLVARVEAAKRRQLVEWTTDLRRLTAEEFEWFVGELYRRDGWDVRETGAQDRADGNVDLLLVMGRERRFVQCKRWTSKWVGVDDIRAFAGTLLREKAAGNSGIFVTLSDFTEPARNEARRTGLTLVGRRELLAHIERVRRPEPCPNCHAPMLLGRSQLGWWFRCTTSGCTGKRNLDHEPALAVDLLTQRPQ